MNSDALNFKNDNVPGANVFSTTITMYAGDRFQICHDGLWDGQVGIGHMAGAELNETGDHATGKDVFGIVVFEAPKNEYHADFKQWDITLAEGQDGIYQFTYTTYEDPTQNVLTWKLIEKLDPGSAPVADCDIYFIGTFNEWSTSYEEGSEYRLYDNEDGTWEGTIIIEENMYGDWTLAEVGTLCAALKLYDAANEAWIGYNGDGNLCLTAGVYRIVYTVSTNSFICEILEPGSIVEGGSGSGSTTGPITWYIRGSMNNWGAEADYKLIYDENGNASITLSLMPGDTFKIADATWSEGNQFNASHISGNANFKESIENQNIEVVNGGTYTITVTATGGLTIVADGEEAPPVVEPVEPTEITLYFYTEWTSVNVYTFANNATVGAEWPGAAMTAVEGEDGWYSAELDKLGWISFLKTDIKDGQKVNLVKNDLENRFIGNVANLEISFDGGQKWCNYTEDMRINGSETVLARYKANGTTLQSASVEYRFEADVVDEKRSYVSIDEIYASLKPGKYFLQKQMPQ